MTWQFDGRGDWIRSSASDRRAMIGQRDRDATDLPEIEPDCTSDDPNRVELDLVEILIRADPKNDSFVLVRQALPLGRPYDWTAHDPVRRHRGAEHVRLMAAGVTSASHTSTAGAAIVTDALAISPVFIDTPEPPRIAQAAR